MKKTFGRILCAVLACTTLVAVSAVAEGEGPKDITSYGGKITYEWTRAVSTDDKWTAFLDACGDNVTLSNAAGVWRWGDETAASQESIGINAGESITFKFDLPDDATSAYVQGLNGLKTNAQMGTFYVSKDGQNYTKLGNDVPFFNKDISSYLEDNASKTIYIQVKAESGNAYDTISRFLQVVYSGCAVPVIGHPELDTEGDDYKKEEKYLFTANDGEVALAENIYTDGKLGLWGDLPLYDESKTLITDYGYKYEKFGPMEPWASGDAVFFFDGGLICHQPRSTGGNAFVFEVPLKAAMKIATLKLNMAGSYNIAVSGDGTVWSTRAVNINAGTDGVVTLDLTDLLDGTDKTAYVKVAVQDIAIDSTALRAAALSWEEGTVLKEAPTTAPTTAPTDNSGEEGKPVTGEPVGMVLPLALLSIGVISTVIFCHKKKA